MAEQEELLAEFERIRERGTGLMQARLSAVREQLREAAARIESDIDIVLPPDPEALFPLARLRELAMAMVPPEPAPTVGIELLRGLDAGRAQSEVLQGMLAHLEPWCGRRAVVVLRDGQATGWAGAGFAENDVVRGWQAAVASSPALSRVAEGSPVLTSATNDGAIGGWLEGARSILLVPMSLRGKVVGALVAGDADGRLEPEPVQLVAFVAGLLLETLAVRSAVPTPALGEVVSLVQVSGAQQVEMPVEPSFEAVEAAAEAVEEPDEVVEDAPEAAEGLREVEEAAEVVELEEAAEVQEAVVEEVAPPADGEPSPVSEAVVEEMPQIVEAAGMGLEPATDDAATVHLKVPVIPTPPAPAPEDERKHEEAKRFARLLVSEIRLYNEQAVLDGKHNRDIYQRLKEDIDRSREMYEQRVAPQIRAESNYFFEELVRILGDGDADALGL